MILALLIVQTIVASSVLFFLTEVIVLFTIIYLFFFYRQVVNPIRAIGNGMELLKEQDFSSRLRHVRQKDADRIVDVFNRMISQLKEERLHVREQNGFLDLLINASPMGVLILDIDGHITSYNPAFLKFIDSDDKNLKGKKLKEVNTILANKLDTLGKDSAETFQMNDSHIYRCSRLSFIDHGYAHPFFLIESLTDEVMKAEKKAYEKVIRMIAHEVNNTTASVTSTLDSITQVLKSMEDTNDMQEVMTACIERCYSMSNFITKFADVVKIPEPQLHPCDINTLTESCLQVQETICCEHKIQLHRHYCDSPLIVKTDSPLLEQVIINIIKNAIESINENGHIHITTTSSPKTLVIADDGVGISQETAQRLFSPFFSTKPNGQGIGLIFIREVLTKHGFKFSLKTNTDGITRFTIIFQ
jgi:nitrogen fixation/metabolism regulation signal transduction histidine kinase